MVKHLAPVVLSSVLLLLNWSLASRPGDPVGAGEEREERDGYVLPARRPWTEAEVKAYLDGIAHREAMVRQQGDRSALAGLTAGSWTNHTPVVSGQPVGGRTKALVIHPATPNLMLAAASSGGIFRSTDSGLSWTPVGDSLPSMDVHTLALAPANPNVVYAGTGDWHPGVGVVRTSNFGLTWEHLPASLALGLRVTGIVVSPADGRLVVQSDNTINSLGYLGARAGRATGIHVSLDAGVTFTRVDSRGSTGSGLAQSLDNPAVLVAANDDGILRSADGGATWQPSTMSPAPSWMFARVSFAASTPGLAYALITENGSGLSSFYHSTDGGATFTRVSGEMFPSRGVIPFRALWVNPVNASHVVVAAVDVRESLDGGVTWRPMNRIGVDYHALVAHPGFDNASNRRLFMASDHGIDEHLDIAVTTALPVRRSTGLANLQLYAGSADPGSGRVLAGAQDREVYELDLSSHQWRYITSGADGLNAVADPRTPDRVYTAALLGSKLMRADFPFPGGLSGADLQRCTEPPPFRLGDDCSSPWAFPWRPFLQLDPRNPDRLYVGTGSSVWRTENAADPIGPGTGPRWTKILDAGGGALGVYALSPANPEVIWAADMGVTGQIRRTTQASAPSPVWQSAGVLGAGEIWSITPHPTLATGAYLTRSVGRAFRTLNAGATWESISGTGATALPPVNIHRIVPHPLGTHYLYAATDLGLFVSEDAGVNWLAGASPANVPIYDLFFMGTDTLVAVTYGRSIFTAYVPEPQPPQTPGAPTGLAADVLGNTVTLRWQAGMGAAASQYRIQAGSSPGLANIAVVNTGTPSTSFAAGVVPNGTYHVRVFGLNGFGQSEPSNELTLVVPVPIPPPGAPGPLVGTITGSNVSLTWEASSGTVTDYVLEAGTATGQSNVLVTSLGGATSFAASNVFPGTYFARIRARNEGGLSGPSNEVILNVGVTGCTAAPGPPVLAAPVVTGSTVSLAWTPPPGPVAGYVIEAGYSAGSTIVTLPAAAGATSLQVNAGAGTYFVRMRAQNACGTSPASNEITVQVPGP